MKFPKLFRRNKRGIVKKSAAKPLNWPIPQGSFLEYALGNSSNLSAQQAFNFYRKNSAVATAVDMIAEAIEQIKPVLKYKDGTIEGDHEIIDLLQQPNGFETYIEFIGKLSRHYLLTHNGYLLALGGIEKPPIELYSPKPMLVMPQEASDGYPASYMISNGMGAGTYVRFEQAGKMVRFVNTNLREMYHIMGFSSRDTDLKGDSPLEAAALETKQQIKSKIHNMSILDNGGRLSMVVSFKEEGRIRPDELQERKDKINEQLAGSENAGKMAVISGPEVNIQELGKTNKDMDFAELDKTASNAIYLRYGIPLPLVSLDASTFNNVENAINFFYENTVLPIYDVLFAGVSKMTLPRYGIDPAESRLTYDPESIAPLMTKMLKELKERRDMNIETINELRALLPGREDIEGGDVLYQPATLLPVGSEIIPEIPDPEKTAEKVFKDREDTRIAEKRLKDLKTGRSETVSLEKVMKDYDMGADKK